MGRSFDHAGRRPKGRPAWALILLVAVWASAARAEDQSQLKISGLVLYENYSYAQRVPGATIDARNELTLRPRVEFSPSQKFDGAASMEFREDASDRGRSKAYLYEAYLNVYFPKWNLTAGRQFIAWGRADTLRPTDLFTRRDYTDLVERREEAIVAVKGDVELGSGMLELVWSPIFEGDILPLAPQNRWFLLPRSLSVASAGPLAAAYQFEDRAEPGNGLESSQVGVRLTGHAGGWDYGLMYAWTLDRIPTYFETRAVQSDLAQGTASVVLVPHYRRLHVFGADFATVLSRIGVRGEAAYTLTENRNGTDDLIDAPYLRVVGGLDYTWNLFGGTELFAILQYAADLEVPRRREPNQESPSDPIRFRHFYRRAGLLNAELRISEFLKPVLKAFVNLEKGDFVLQPEIRWVPLDGLAVTVGADLLGGGEGTFFGAFRKNSRARAQLTGRF